MGEKQIKEYFSQIILLLLHGNDCNKSILFILHLSDSIISLFKQLTRSSRGSAIRASFRNRIPVSYARKLQDSFKVSRIGKSSEKNNWKRRKERIKHKRIYMLHCNWQKYCVLIEIILTLISCFLLFQVNSVGAASARTALQNDALILVTGTPSSASAISAKKSTFERISLDNLRSERISWAKRYQISKGKMTATRMFLTWKHRNSLHSLER